MDNDVYDFVVDWKPRRKTSKSNEICDTIFNMYSFSGVAMVWFVSWRFMMLSLCLD